MGLFSKKEPLIPFKDFLYGQTDVEELLNVSKRAITPYLDFVENTLRLQTIGKGTNCLYHFDTFSDMKPDKVYKNEDVDGYFILQRAVDCGSSLAALYLALLLDHRVGHCPADKLAPADDYFQMAISRGGGSERLAQAIITVQPFASIFSKFTSDPKEALAVAIFHAATYDDEDPIFNEVKSIIGGVDKKAFQWIADMLICWYASQKKLLSLAILAHVLTKYKDDDGMIKKEQFYNLFKFLPGIEGLGKRILKHHLYPQHNAGNKIVTEILELYSLLE